MPTGCLTINSICKVVPFPRPGHFLFYFFSRATAIPSRRKKGNRCARGWCVRRGSLLQDGLPVNFEDVKFKDPKFKYEIKT